MLPIVRWTIGPVQPAGFECLHISIKKFIDLYNFELVICYNGLSKSQVDDISTLPARLVNQEEQSFIGDHPIGVAWKLTPPRLDINRHEIFIDNDLVLTEKLNQIDLFLSKSDTTLLLEAEARHYGRFEQQVPRGYNINSGLFGVPPGFDLGYYVSLLGRWEENCPNTSKTWDEQGLVASTLLQYKHTIIPETVITNCHAELIAASGMHFVGLNRNPYHRPFAEYRTKIIPFFL